MSRIATTTGLQGVLEDYKIHLTGESPTSNDPEPTTPRASNPPNWPVDHRRVPDYRPVDRNRDVEGRPNGENAFERVFLTIMFTGVVTNAVSDKDTGNTRDNMLTSTIRLLRRFGEPQLGHTFLDCSDTL